MDAIFSFLLLLFKIYLIFFVILNLIFILKPKIAHYMLFQNYINLPTGDLSRPKLFGLDSVHNFYMNVEDGVRVGIWHYIPKDFKHLYDCQKSDNIEAHFDLFFKEYDGKPIIIYAHGNDQNRGKSSRIALCSRLADMNYHVFAIDYRGYGDSTGVPTEQGVVADVVHLYEFIKSYKSEAKVYLWGLSLGSAIVAHAAKVLTDKNLYPHGVILESPFLNATGVMVDYKVVSLFMTNNPLSKKLLESSFDRMNINFNTDRNIAKIKSKILIFHSECDGFVPYYRSYDLIRIAKTKRPKDYPDVELHIVDKMHNIGHSDIYTHEDIYPIVEKFIQ